MILKDGLRAMGWGLFEIEQTRDGFEVTTHDPPSTSDAETIESRFLYGMVTGALESALKSDASRGIEERQ